MALAITKNDISGVYGNPAPLKITKSDISSVYAKTPATAGYYSALSKSPIVKGRWQNDSFDGGVTAKQQSPHKTGTLSDTSPFTITKSDISTIYSAPKTTDKTPPQTAYAGAKQKKKGSLADTLMAFGDWGKEGGRTSFENAASAADYSSIGISQMADMEKRLQNIDITDPQRISDAMKANYEEKGINSPAALAIKQKIADRTRQQQQRQAQLYEKHRNAPFADRAAKLGFVTGAAAPSIVTGGVVSPGFATALNAVNSYGAAQGQAISEGTTLQQSGLYAAATAGKEYVINQLFGGIPYLSGKTYYPNAINILGEGAENVLSDVTQPYLKRIFYDKDAPAPTFKDLLSSFADGVDVSLFLNTAPDLVKIKPDDRMGIIHKAYAEELDRQIKQEMKEKHPELFETQKPTSKKQAEADYDIEKVMEEAYNNRRWAVENEGLLTKRQYKRYLELTTGRITGDEKWLITNTTNGDNLVKVGDWIVHSNGDFANAPIIELIKVDTKYRKKVWRYLYEASTKGEPIEQKTIDYYVRSRFARRYRRTDFADYSSVRKSGRNDNKNAGNTGQQSKRGRNTGKSGGLLSGYKGEKLKNYPENRVGFPYITLIDGQDYVIERYKGGEYNSLIGPSDSFDTLEEAVIAANKQLIKNKKKNKK